MSPLPLALVRILALWVPRASRDGWIEEWSGELHHAATVFASRRFPAVRLLRMALGAVPDVIAVRRAARFIHRVPGPRGRIFHGISQDLRFGCRALAGSPGFAVSVIASLSIGIAANTAAFSFINAAVFRPFPGVTNQRELVRVGVSTRTRFGIWEISSTHEEYETLRGGMPGLQDLAAHYRVEFAGFFRGEASALDGALVTGNYFDVLGVRPAAGRVFLPRDEADGHAAVVISHALWRRWFRADPEAVGQFLTVNGAALEIVGVAPPQFHGVQKGSYGIDVWVPFSLAHLALRGPDRRPVSVVAAGYLPFTYIGRRRTTLEQVAAQAASLTRQINEHRTGEKQGATVSVGRVWLNDPVKAAPAIVGFMMVPLLVLAIACVNAANLLLARSSQRSRDWRVRLALGASKWRIVRQVLVESALLAIIAAGAGLALTSWALKLVAHLWPMPLPMDARVLLFTVATAVGTAIAFGLAPALHVSSRAADPSGLSRIVTGPARSRVRFALIATQAALSLGLLATGAQFVKTVHAQTGRADSVPPERLLIASFDLDPLNVRREAADDFYARVLEGTSSVPGVVAAGFSIGGLITDAMDMSAAARIWLPQQGPGEGKNQLAAHASRGFFAAAGVPLLQGRLFTDAERATPVSSVIVNQSFASTFLESNALNRRLRIGTRNSEYGAALDVTVIGVVGVATGYRPDSYPMLYYPAPVAHAPARTLYVLFDESGRFNLTALQAVVRQVDARVPVRSPATLRERRESTGTERRFLASGVAALGIFALLLAAGGLYSVVSYVVALRRHEIGVRLALGSTGYAVVGLIVREALAPTAIGALAGTGGAVATALVVRSRMYGAAPVDPLSFAAAAAFLLLTMAVAALIPARHAAGVDPMVVLREE